MRKVKNLIVGCGLSGATIAYKIATELNEKVLIVDRKEHFAGNCYDYWDENGICVHKYGAHIFHTNLKNVWDFLGQFTKWHPYQHEVKGFIDGQNVPIPFNLNSIQMIFPKVIAYDLEKKLIDRFGFNTKVPILDLINTDDSGLKMLANYIYEKVFLNYSIKQWGMKPEELNSTVTGRVPVCISKDDRYFQDKYQGIPSLGYTEMVSKMIEHPNIDVELGVSFNEIEKWVQYEKLFYTGPH